MGSVAVLTGSPTRRMWVPPSFRSLLKLNMYSALLWLKKIVRLHVVVFWGSLLHNLRLSAVANFLFPRHA